MRLPRARPPLWLRWAGPTAPSTRKGIPMASVGRPNYAFHAQGHPYGFGGQAQLRLPRTRPSLWLRWAGLQNHFVTRSVNGEDDFWLVGAYLDFLPESRDEIVDRTGSELGVVAPYMLQQV